MRDRFVHLRCLFLIGNLKQNVFKLFLFLIDFQKGGDSQLDSI